MLAPKEPASVALVPSLANIRDSETETLISREAFSDGMEDVRGIALLMSCRLWFGCVGYPDLLGRPPEEALKSILSLFRTNKTRTRKIM